MSLAASTGSLPPALKGKRRVQASLDQRGVLVPHGLDAYAGLWDSLPPLVITTTTDNHDLLERGGERERERAPPPVPPRQTNGSARPGGGGEVRLIP